MGHILSLRITGFVLSLLLTLTAYAIILHSEWFDLSTRAAMVVIFVLALTQSLVQSIFFINVWKEEGPLWNLAVFISTISMIFVIIYFSVWIINHLNYNMH